MRLPPRPEISNIRTHFRFAFTSLFKDEINFPTLYTQQKT